VSGWRYPSWRGDFYPKGLAQRRELEYIGEQMTSVEINGSFYSLQRPDSYRRWRDAVSPELVFAVKGSRYITHMLRLRNIEQALANFFASGVLALGSQLGPILWQLPARQHFEADVVEAFLSTLPTTTGQALELARRHDERLKGRTWLEIEADVPLRYALEPRSAGFGDEHSVALLRQHGVALAVADTAGTWPRFDEITADFVYVRLHGAHDLYASGYSDDELRGWASDVRGWMDGAPDGMPRDVYVYFDNDARGHAPHDARALVGMLPRPFEVGTAGEGG
jgi:uncharacterized protein YecE (DUF72 family)